MKIAILGSTGSIGVNSLDVARRNPDKFKVIALSTNSNIKLLEQQIKEFKPAYVCVKEKSAAAVLAPKIKKSSTKLFVGNQGIEIILEDKRIERIVLAISGSEALVPLLIALKNHKDVALANKEALVAAGPLIMGLAIENKTKIIPVDSEQSAIWQCLEGQDRNKLKKIYLTASGGPFLNSGKRRLDNISVEKVLKHPRWKMGKKITVDSATLMNKGLELLEAMFLFNLEAEKIKVLIHPEAIIHSMVEFIDGVILAQLSATDMRIPIQYALTYPERLSNEFPRVDFLKLQRLNFNKPDFSKFPCLGLAYRAARQLGTMPAVLNAANEICVEEFLKERINFGSIPRIVEKVMDHNRNNKTPDLEDIYQADSWARREAIKLC